MYDFAYRRATSVEDATAGVAAAEEGKFVPPAA